ncbi:hypothetical protein [Streptomyces sp. NPDC006739]|uniref:hypothetical protein n=1 Tax=Streptomyces sp. NPDC006739 TaxID=3364763 RepID=UPI00368063D0
MFELELHQLRAAELRRQADGERLAREAVRSLRAARRAARGEEEARHTAGTEAHTDRPRRHRHPHTA